MPRGVPRVLLGPGDYTSGRSTRPHPPADGGALQARRCLRSRRPAPATVRLGHETFFLLRAPHVQLDRFNARDSSHFCRRLSRARLREPYLRIVVVTWSVIL